MPPRKVRMIGQTLSRIVAHVPWLWPLMRGPVQRFWDRSAGSWDVNETPNRTNAMQQALPHLDTSPARILEIGCGTGSATQIIKRQFPDAQLTGVDLSPEMVRIASVKVPGVTFEPADASRLPFDAASFDLVVQNNVPVYFDEIARVLAQRGRVLITSTFGPNTPYYTPHNVLKKRFGKLGFTDLRSEQAPPGDWFSACKPS